MRCAALFLTLCFVSPCLFAQQSMFESGDGRTSLYLRQPTAAVNLGDSKASFGYLHRVSTSPISLGVGAYATANTGIASLFSSDKPKAPEGGFDGVLGYHYDPKPADCPNGQATCSFVVKNNTFLIDGGYGRSSFYLYPTGVPPSANTQKANFDRFRALTGWNLFYNGRIVLGLVAGAERRNNLSDLKSVSLETTIVAAPPGGSSSIVKTQAGYYGTYKEYVGAPIYEDFLFYVPVKVKAPGSNNRLGLDLLSRSDAAAVNRGASGGIGLFLFDKDDPFKTIGGITATYDGTKFQVSLTIGFTSKQ